MELHNAFMFTSCPGASFVTRLAVFIGLVLVRLDLMHSTKPFLISGGRRLPCSLKSFLYRSTAVFILNSKNNNNMSSLNFICTVAHVCII